jgi:hypothetical protein
MDQSIHFNEDESMKTTHVKKGVVPLATIVAGGCLALFFGSAANAGCVDLGGLKPASMHGDLSSFPGVKLVPASFTQTAAFEEETNFPENRYAIVGLWKMTMTAKGNKAPKDGTPIDFGYQVWHSDGTELITSGSRPPSTGDVCQGAWERTSYHHYVLNHFGLSWDPTGTVFVGPANIKEEIVVDESRNHYAGTFEIIQYSTDEKTVLGGVKGVVTGDRVTAR